MTFHWLADIEQYVLDPRQNSWNQVIVSKTSNNRDTMLILGKYIEKNYYFLINLISG
jgi:hypothetical protein